MRHFTQKRGAVLIVVLGVLFVLTLLATMFATLQASERNVSRNYLDTVRARLMTQAGIQHAQGLIEELFPFLYLDTSVPSAWRYWGDYLDEGNDAAWTTGAPSPENIPIFRVQNPSFAVEEDGDPSNVDNVRPKIVLVNGQPRGFSGSARTGTYGKGGDQYVLRVSDLSGRLYINDGVDYGPTHPVSVNMKRILNRLGEIPWIGINDLGDLAIGNRPPYGYNNIRELANHLPNGEADLAKIRPFITVHAWVDDSVALPVPLNNDLALNYANAYGCPDYGSRNGVFRRSRGVDVAGTPIATALNTIPPVTDPEHETIGVYGLDTLNPQWVEIVSRAPVNINSASKEVIVALLADLRGVFLGERRRNNPRFQGDLYLGFRIIYSYSPAGTEGDEIGFLRETFPILAPGGTMDESTGISPFKIADELIACREKAVSPTNGSFDYKNVPWSGIFSSWEQFNLFIDHLVFNPFRNPAEHVGLLREPASRDWLNVDYKAEGCDPSGYNSVVVSDWQRLLSNRALGDVLKANFNPNLHLNELNPDANLFQLVDKTDLIVNSTEFNFLPTGFVEVECLGRILRPMTGEDCLAAGVDNQLVAQARAVTVFKFYNLYRETTQHHFYRGTLQARPAGAFETNNNMTLEVGPEPDNGTFFTCLSEDLEDPTCGLEYDGYIQLPTNGSVYHSHATKAKNTTLATLNASPSRHPIQDCMHAHFQLDHDLHYHRYGAMKEIASGPASTGSLPLGEDVYNWPDVGATGGGPYNPVNGNHRICRSFRSPRIGGTGTIPNLVSSVPSDLRLDGAYAERHACPAYQINEGVDYGTSVSNNIRQKIDKHQCWHIWNLETGYTQASVGRWGNVVKANYRSDRYQIMNSIWVKPYFHPEFTGKERILWDISRYHSQCGQGVKTYPFGFWFFPAHFNSAISEGNWVHGSNALAIVPDMQDKLHIGRPDYSGNAIGALHPMSVTWGFKHWHTGPEARFGVMSRSLNHTGHQDETTRPTIMRANRWIHFTFNVNQQWWYPSHTPFSPYDGRQRRMIVQTRKSFLSDNIWVNGHRLHTPDEVAGVSNGDAHKLTQQVDAWRCNNIRENYNHASGNTAVHFYAHGPIQSKSAQIVASNQLRLGATSRICGNYGLFDEGAGQGNKNNPSGDWTLDEFFAWQGPEAIPTDPNLLHYAGDAHLRPNIPPMIERETWQWKIGRYHNPTASSTSANCRFTSAPFELMGATKRGLPPPTTATPPGGTGSGGGSVTPYIPGGEQVKILGMQWTWIGEAYYSDKKKLIADKPVLYDYSTIYQDIASYQSVLDPIQINPIVQVWLIDGAQEYGPPDDVNDYSYFMPVVDSNGNPPAVSDPSQLKYQVRFLFPGLSSTAVLLGTPVLDDVTVYWDNGERRLVSFVWDNRVF